MWTGTPGDLSPQTQISPLGSWLIYSHHEERSRDANFKASETQEMSIRRHQSLSDAHFFSGTSREPQRWRSSLEDFINCWLDSYKSQLKPQFDHRRPPRRFGRLWNCATVQPHQQKYEDRRQNSSWNSVSEVWKRTSDKDDAFWKQT